MTDAQETPTDPFGLFAEAERQLNICNSCRYCEGYCAVFPALERRTVLETGDITQLANLCHDCRACFHACMYAPPHEFAVNPPEILTRVRRAGYQSYVTTRFLPARLRSRNPLVTAAVLVTAALLLLVAVDGSIGALGRHDGPTGSSPIRPCWRRRCCPPSGASPSFSVPPRATGATSTARCGTSPHRPRSAERSPRPPGSAICAAAERTATRPVMIRHRPDADGTMPCPTASRRASPPPSRRRCCRT